MQTILNIYNTLALITGHIFLPLILAMGIVALAKWDIMGKLKE